ncbi:MAG: hypothetical protein WD512_06240 [Candidatus Paceibacterota bacterium]
MPYKIKKGTGKRPYKIINKETNKQVGSSISKEMAEKAIRARHANKK